MPQQVSDPSRFDRSAFRSRNVKRTAEWRWVPVLKFWVCEAHSNETGDAMLATYDGKRFRFFELQYSEEV